MTVNGENCTDPRSIEQTGCCHRWCDAASGHKSDSANQPTDSGRGAVWAMNNHTADGAWELRESRTGAGFGTTRRERRSRMPGSSRLEAHPTQQAVSGGVCHQRYAGVQPAQSRRWRMR